MQVKLTNAHVQSSKEKNQRTDLDMRLSWQQLSAGFNSGFLDGGGTGARSTQARPLRSSVPLEENDEALQAVGMSRTVSPAGFPLSCLMKERGTDSSTS